MRRSVFRLGKDLLGLRRNSVPNSPISVGLPSSLPTVTRGSIPRRIRCQESVDYDTWEWPVRAATDSNRASF